MSMYNAAPAASSAATVEGWIREYRSQVYALGQDIACLRVLNPAHKGIPTLQAKVDRLLEKVAILESLHAPVFTSQQQRVIGDAYRAIVDASSDLHDELRFAQNDEAKMRIWALCQDLEARFTALSTAAGNAVEPTDPRRV